MQPKPPGMASIYFIVFACGAAVMVVELLGSRILAPYAGNSLFVWTSLIGIVLAAMSLGYYAGGKAADARPTLEALSQVIFAAGVWVGLIPVLEFAIPYIVLLFGIKLGSLIASALLFAVPSFLLGFVSPYSVKLATESMNVIGSSAGSLYSVSTAGSIAGTVLAGFVLIPSFGVKALTFGVSGVLVLVSLYGMRRRLAYGSSALVVIGILAYAFTSAHSGIVFQKDSAYYLVSVYDHGAERRMGLDAQNAGGIWLNSSAHLNGYSAAARLAYAVIPSPASVLVIGLGPAVQANDARRTYPSASVDVVEIDQTVVDAAEAYFNFTPDSRTHVIVEDARVFLAGPGAQYDIIFMDAFNSRYSIPTHLATREAFAAAKTRLRPGGAYAANIISAVNGSKSEVFRSLYKTLASEYRTVYVIPILPAAPERVQNIILIATDSEPLGWEEWLTRAASVQGEPALAWAPNRWNQSIVTGDVPLLTDDYAPLDVFTDRLSD